MASVAEAQQSTQEALALAVSERRFPDEALGFAEKLLNRLETPLRVSVMGMPQSGKSGIFNLLAGTEVLTDGPSATVQLTHGEIEKATATLKDGSTLTLEGPFDMPRIGSLAPVFVQLEADLPALRKISLMEVVTSDERAEQIRAVRWAMKQTDIAIWCSTDFDAAEQALWQTAPDTLKDHAIFVRTMADQVGNRRDAEISTLQRTADADFAYFLPVSAQEAQSARLAPGGLNKQAFKASGATALIGTILRQIEHGRQNAVDRAEILLHQHRDAKPRPAPATMPEPAAPAEVIPFVEPKSVSDTTDAASVDEISPEVAELPCLSALSEASAPKVTPTVTPEASAEEEHEALSTAVNRLQDAGGKMANMDALDPADIVGEALVALDSLSEFLESEAVPSTPSIRTFRDMTQDAANLMQLLRIEGGTDSALEAVSAMLQIKRSMQAELAA